MVNRMTPPPQDVPVLNLITHEYMILHGKWNFADVTNGMDLQMKKNILVYPGGPNLII